VSLLAKLDPEPKGIPPGSPPNNSALEAMAHYMDNPLHWVEDFTGYELDDWQKAVLISLVLDKFVAVRSGKGVGKTFLVALAILFFLTTRPRVKIMCTAPTKEQMYDALWAQVATIIKDSPVLADILDWTQTKVYVKGHSEDWWAVARTAEVRKSKTGELNTTVEALQGKHAETEVYFLDEASAIQEAVHNTVWSSITSEEAFILMTSNPTQTQGTFYEAFHRNSHIWKTFHVNAEDSPRVSRAQIQRMLDTYGSREHPLYRIGVRGEFPVAQANALYPLDLIEASYQLGMNPGDKGYLAANPLDPYILGVDVGRGGNLSAIAFKRGPIVEEVQMFDYGDLMEVAGRVIYAIRDKNPAEVKVDISGIGAGVYDRLKELGYRQVVGYNSGWKAADPKQFANFRAEGHWKLRRLMENHQIRLPVNDRLKSEMAVILYKISSAGKIQVESKEEMLARGVKSPDHLDAVVMACSTIPLPADKPIFHGARFGAVAFMGR
jgi:phage terminase large subunit